MPQEEEEEERRLQRGLKRLCRTNKEGNQLALKKRKRKDKSNPNTITKTGVAYGNSHSYGNSHMAYINSTKGRSQMHLRCSLRILHLLACQVRVAVGDSGLCFIVLSPFPVKEEDKCVGCETPSV